MKNVRIVSVAGSEGLFPITRSGCLDLDALESLLKRHAPDISVLGTPLSMYKNFIMKVSKTEREDGEVLCGVDGRWIIYVQISEDAAVLLKRLIEENDWLYEEIKRVCLRFPGSGKARIVGVDVR